MKKIFPYLSESTAKRLRQMALSRSAKLRHIVESAIESYVNATEQQRCADDPHLRLRYEIALQTAQSAVAKRRKTGLTKVGTCISTLHHDLLLSIQVPKGQFLSDTVELVLSYFLWRDPSAQDERDVFSGFLWPFIHLPSHVNLATFVKEMSEPF